MADLNERIEQRLAIERELQSARPDPSAQRPAEYVRRYHDLREGILRDFRDAKKEPDKIALMLELIRLLESELVSLHNFVPDPTQDNRALAQQVERFLEELGRSGSPVLSSIERSYFRGVAALVAGDTATARHCFEQVCGSEESDETSDVKFKSYLMLGHLSSEEADYGRARELHDAAAGQTRHPNVAAQAVALKALNTYALGRRDEALELFDTALGLFDQDQAFYNPYFHRNALLFQGLIHFERHDYEQARESYLAVLERVGPESFDAFEALSHLGRIDLAVGRYPDAV
ncbi:MAG TPA: tetratricopeptide repeat protein, partial [Thermoanaerobaculia bacterium]|nr:tetratricopeptide repeat protein [Thermoanaerobaculia bacterium]